MVDEHTQAAAAENLREEDLDLGLTLSQARLYVCLQRGHQLTPYAKKAGGRPLSVLLAWPADRSATGRHESSHPSIALASHRIVRSGPLRIAPCTISVQPVIRALGSQRARQSQVLACLAMASEQLHRASQTEQRIVVGGRARGHRLELGGGSFVALRVEQRPSERLADRLLVGL